MNNPTPTRLRRVLVCAPLLVCLFFAGEQVTASSTGVALPE